MERSRSGGIECTKGSCACDFGDSTKVFSGADNGDSKREKCNKDVSEVSRDAEKKILGESFSFGQEDIV